ncbi:MAG TPA: HAD-IIA family hydrolase [Verrucomicrobiae bacterium]|nr:HAD-IIA family hydrolase [Verrucomicrobiae bacterium]
MDLPQEVSRERLKRIRHVALDMDGTIYNGKTLLPSTLPFLQTIQELSIGCTFLTNNSSKSTRDYVAHLARFGIQADPEQIYTSTKATTAWLRREHPGIRRLFVLGTRSLRAELTDAGFIVTNDEAQDEPDAVLAGFDTELNYARLCRAAYWIGQAKPYFATHPDLVCPTDEPTLLVDCGSICCALEKATGRRPDEVLGKPDPAMLAGILGRYSLKVDELAMVGDRLYTDLAMARRTGVLGVLVLTGETTAADVQEAGLPIDLVLPDLGEFGKQLRLAWQS